MSTQFITDSEGKKIAAVLPIEEYAELMEDLEDLAAIADMKDHRRIPWEDVKKDLARRTEKDAVTQA